MNEILEILQGVRSDIDFEYEKRLIDDNILDSFDIITIVGELNEEFAIEIDIEDLEPENFNSLEAITDLVEGLQG